jgi:hypothetical protein
MKFYLTQDPSYGTKMIGRRLLTPEGYIYPLSTKEKFISMEMNPELIDKEDVIFWPDKGDMFILSDKSVEEKGDILDGMSYVEKITRNLNTAIDVYFKYKGNTYSVRFQDWNIFSVWSDEKAFEQLKLYIAKNQE